MPAPIPQSGEIVLNNVRFKLARPIIERSIDQFPAKIVQGDTRLRDQTLASEWVFAGDLTDGAGVVQCYTDPPGGVTSIDDCPAVDTTFNDCFKIIRGVNMTMVGSGVEWEEENTTWLVKNYGIVKTELKVRWGESIWFDSDDEIWAGYSRWEMGQYSSEPGDEGLLSKMLNPVRSVKLNSLSDMDELDNDPYQIHRTLGLHRIQFPAEH